MRSASASELRYAGEASTDAASPDPPAEEADGGLGHRGPGWLMAG